MAIKQPKVWKPKGRDHWVTEFEIKKRRYFVNLTDKHGAQTKPQALAAARIAYESCVTQNRQESSAQGLPTLFGAAADLYYQQVGQHVANAVAIERDLNRLKTFAGRDKITLDLKSLFEIDDSLVMEIVSWRRAHFRYDDPKYGLISASHVNRSATEVLSRVMNHARDVWKFTLPKMPSWGARALPVPKKEPRIVRAHEDIALQEVIDPDFETVRQFSLATGLRQRESLIRWAQVDFIAKRITDIRVKGGGERSIPMTDRMEEILRTRVGHDETFVFTYVVQKTRKQTNHVRGIRMPITQSGLVTHFARARKNAGLANTRAGGICWHTHRHTTGTYAAAAGGLIATQQLLGHQDSATTLIYAHVFDPQMRATMEGADKHREAAIEEARKRRDAR